RGRRFDLVHVHLANLQADVVALAARVSGRPVYVKIACGGSIGEISRMSRAAILTRRIGLRRAAVVQALSEEIRGELVAIGVDEARIVRLPNGLDRTRFRPSARAERAELRRRLGLPDGVLVMFAGRFAAYKGIDDLLSAW